VRLDSHLFSGYTVPPHYDSMVAKIITSGARQDRTSVHPDRAPERDDLRHHRIVVRRTV